MSETLTKPPTLTELKVAARVLLEEDPSLTAARYALRMQEAKDLLDESIRQSNVGTKTYLAFITASWVFFQSSWSSPMTATSRSSWPA